MVLRSCSRLAPDGRQKRVVSSGIMIFGAITAAAGSIRAFPLLGGAMLVGGAAWIVFISLFNVLILNHAPE